MTKVEDEDLRHVFDVLDIDPRIQEKLVAGGIRNIRDLCDSWRGLQQGGNFEGVPTETEEKLVSFAEWLSERNEGGRIRVNITTAFTYLTYENKFYCYSREYPDDFDDEFDSRLQTRIWRPNSWKNNGYLAQLYECLDEVFDVTFNVGQNEKIHFNASKTVLVVQAPALFELVKDLQPVDETGKCTLDIEDVEVANFERFHCYLYHGEYTEPDNKQEQQNVRKDLLSLADKFGCCHLKFHLEAEMIEKDFSIKTALSLLLLSDVHKCALLKEFAIKFCTVNADEVMKLDDWKLVEASNQLLIEIVRESTLGKRERYVARVADLRDKLQDAGFNLQELDGTYEMLVLEWKEHNMKKKRTIYQVG